MIDHVLKTQMEGLVRPDFEHFLSLCRLQNKGFGLLYGRNNKSDNLFLRVSGNGKEFNLLPRG